MCVDPINPGCYFAGDSTSIRYCTPDTVTLFAGDESTGFADGVGSAARFDGVADLLCTANGEKLYAADCGNIRIRLVDTKTQAVTTLAGNGAEPFDYTSPASRQGRIYKPYKFTFDRSRATKPESVLYYRSGHLICRFEIQTGATAVIDLDGIDETCDRNTSRSFYPFTADCTPSGHLIVTCANTNGVYAIDPVTCKAELLVSKNDPGFDVRGRQMVDGSGDVARCGWMWDLVVVDSDQCAYIIDRSFRLLRHMTLPARFFESQPTASH